MSSKAVKEFVRYLQLKTLQRQGKQTISDSSSLQKYSEQINEAYINGKDLTKYKQGIDLLKDLKDSNSFEGNTSQIKDFSSEELVTKQFEYNQNYSELLKGARPILKTSADYFNWKGQLDRAYANNNSLEEFNYSLSMFEALRQAENSAVYQSDVDNYTKDNSNFIKFAGITEGLGSVYQPTSFTNTQEFTSSLNAFNNSNNDISFIGSTQEEVDYDVSVPETNRVVLRLDNYGTVQNSEAFFDENGLVDVSQLTTQRHQEEKETMFRGLVKECKTQEEVDQLVDMFEPTPLGNPDPETPIVDCEQAEADFKSDFEVTRDRLSDTFNFNENNMNIGNNASTMVDQGQTDLYEVFLDVKRTFEPELTP